MSEQWAELIQKHDKALSEVMLNPVNKDTMKTFLPSHPKGYGWIMDYVVRPLAVEDGDSSLLIDKELLKAECIAITQLNISTALELERG